MTLASFNRERPHQALGYHTPGQVFDEEQPRKCIQNQKMVLLSGAEPLPRVAEDFLNLASVLFE